MVGSESSVHPGMKLMNGDHDPHFFPFLSWQTNRYRVSHLDLNLLMLRQHLSKQIFLLNLAAVRLLKKKRMYMPLLRILATNKKGKKRNGDNTKKPQENGEPLARAHGWQFKWLAV